MPRTQVHQRGRSAQGPNPRYHNHKDQHWPKLWEGRTGDQATAAGPTDAPIADSTQAVTDAAGCTPLGPDDPDTRPEEQATGDAGALPTPPAGPRRDDHTENTRARPQETAEGDGGEGPDSRCAE